VKEELAKRFGAHRVQDVPTAEGEMPLIMLDLELKSPVSVLMTNGLSDYKMPVPEKMEGREYNELFFCLPSYWEWEDMDNSRTNWVFHWIQRLSKYVLENETWFGHGHTMPCGSNMESLSETMTQNHLFLSDPILLEMELAPVTVDGREINFLGIIPIFSDEMDYKQGKGTFKLMQKLRGKMVTEQLDDYRATVLKRNWKLRR
jgi:hypothetical protein